MTPTGVSVTHRQKQVLKQILHLPMDAREIADSLSFSASYDEKPLVPMEYSGAWTYDNVHAILRRLEDKQAVRRIYREGAAAAKWELTVAGRWAATSDS